jgi:hypothetical protein
MVLTNRQTEKLNFDTNYITINLITDLKPSPVDIRQRDQLRI